MENDKKNFEYQVKVYKNTWKYRKEIAVLRNR